MQNVIFNWEDGTQSIESFNKEQEVFDFIDSIIKDNGICCDNFYSDPPNANWTF